MIGSNDERLGFRSAEIPAEGRAHAVRRLPFLARMDLLSCAGIAMALVSLLGGQALEGGHLGELLNLPALVVVVAGTVGAIMLQVPLPTFVAALSQLVLVFHPPVTDRPAVADRLVRWSRLCRRDGMLALERHLEGESDALVRKGLRLLMDGADARTIRDSLEVAADIRQDRELSIARVYEAMGGYAPTIGILGAVMGLMGVMGDLDDPQQLGAGVAAAFVATIYGVAMANLLLLPISNKLKTLVLEQGHIDEMLIDGLTAIAAGDSAAMVEARLRGYLDE